MREHPNGAELLAIARDALRKDLLPLLPKDKQYDVLMLANAMSIAERQLQQGEWPEHQEREALCQLLHMQGDVVALNMMLARKIRSGKLDDSMEAQQLLWRMTVQRVRESAPKALAAYGMK